jgi:hypothetical protein
VFLTSSRRLLAEAVTAQEFADFDLSELSRLLQQSSRVRWDATQAESKAVKRNQPLVVRVRDTAHVLSPEPPEGLSAAFVYVNALR